MALSIVTKNEDRETTRKHVAFLLLFAILIYFVGNSNLAITDPVESNYMETAKEMLASGDFVSPRIYGNYWYDKPVMFYWELIVAFQLFGVNEFAARFFPGFFMTASLLLTYAFGRHLFGARLGFVAALLLGTSVEGWYVGHAVITDTTLFFAMSAMLVAFYLGYTRQGRHWVLWYYLAFFLAGIAVLTKGPIGLCLPGLIILLFLAWERRLKELLSRHILAGFVLFFAVCAAWYVPMVELHGAAFLDTFLGVHNVLRATVPEHPETSTWYFYLLVFFGGFFPWSIVGVPAALKKLFLRDIHLPQDAATRFLVVWAVAVFGTFECFATKYITYTFPYMIPLAILFARYFVHHVQLTKLVAGAMTAFLVVAACFIAPPKMLDHSGKVAAEALVPLVAQMTAERGKAPIVVSYNTDYQASLAFYSGIFVERLESQAAIDQLHSPDETISWNAKDVMPFRAIESLPKDRDILLITGADGEHGGRLTTKSLEKALGGTWEQGETAGNRRFFLRRAEGAEE